MRTLRTVLCLSLFFVSLFLTGGCTNEDAPEKKAITLDELPSDARTYLAFLFPDQSPLKVEKANGADTTAYHFRATYADEVSIDFNEKGYWKNIHVPNGDVPKEVAGRFNELYDFITNAYRENTLTGITRTDYGESATLNDGQCIAFDFTGKCLGKELGTEGYKSLPDGILQLISLHFPEAGYKHIVESLITNEITAYKYRLWLDNQYTLFINPQDEWVDINGNGQVLPQTLISTLPEKIQKKLGNVKSIYQISIVKNGKEYRIWDSPASSISISTEDYPPINLNPKEIQAFIDEYFGTMTSKSISIPAGNEAPLKYTVQLPNGFDFILGPQLFQWSEVDGHGYPFQSMQEKLLPESALQYITANSKAKITKARLSSDGYLLILSDGTAFQFTLTGRFVSRENVTLTAYEKAYTYMRYQYPKEYAHFNSWIQNIGWTFTLEDGTQIKFDPKGYPTTM